jgi:hypothetical protein
LLQIKRIELLCLDGKCQLNGSSFNGIFVFGFALPFTLWDKLRASGKEPYSTVKTSDLGLIAESLFYNCLQCKDLGNSDY